MKEKMKYHGVTDYLETKRDIETNKLNIDYFKHSIYSKEALDIIKKWHDKYLNFFINNDCIFNLSAGLDSRVLLSFLIKIDKEFLIDNYHRTTVNFKVDDRYDIEFIDIMCNKYHNLKRAKEVPKKSYIVGGHFSEWYRDQRVFKDIKFIEYANSCKKNRRIYPMIDEDLLTIDPGIKNLLNYIIIYLYAPELLEYDFLSGKNFYNYNEQYIIKKILESKFKDVKL